MARTPDGPVDPAELLRQFEEQLKGLDHAALSSMARRLLSSSPGGYGLDPLSAPAPASACRPRRDDVVTLRVRVDLQGTTPPLWRRLELASDMLLSELHEVLQTVFGWTDSHLHRFSSGASIYDRSAESYLMPFEVEEGEEGVPENEVHLDELLVDVGDRLTYGYDFGDDWMHTVKLEAVLPRAAGAPRAACTAGRRPGPPEDCGGVGGYEMWCVATDPNHPDHAVALAEVTDMYGEDLDLADLTPTPFDLDEINSALAAPAPSGIDLPDVLADLVRAIGNVRDAAWLEKSISTIERPDDPDAEVAAHAVHPFTWLLDRVGADGITLTGAGYLRPADVLAVAQVLGITERGIGKFNREVQTYPVLAFREAAQRARLVRKHRGTLVLTPAGRALRTDPVGLWRHLATHLPVSTGGFERQAELLFLIGVAAEWDDLDAGIARMLTAIGWVSDHRPPSPSEAHGASQRTRTVVRQLGGITGGWNAERITDVGAAFARAAVWTWP